MPISQHRGFQRVGAIIHSPLRVDLFMLSFQFLLILLIILLNRLTISILKNSILVTVMLHLVTAAVKLLH